MPPTTTEKSSCSHHHYPTPRRGPLLTSTHYRKLVRPAAFWVGGYAVAFVVIACALIVRIARSSATLCRALCTRNDNTGTDRQE